MLLYTEPRRFFWLNLDPCGIHLLIQSGFATKTHCGFGGANMLDYRFVALQRLSRPVGANEVEAAMFNRIPLRGSRRVVGHRDCQAKLIGQILQPRFPRPAAVAVRATTISFDQQTRLSG